jgi:hypothetical protein
VEFIRPSATTETNAEALRRVEEEVATASLSDPVRRALYMGAPMELVRDVLPCAKKSAATLAIAILIYRRSLLSRTKQVRLRARELAYLGIDDRVAQKALQSLSDCGYIAVEANDGKRPVIDLLWGPKQS